MTEDGRTGRREDEGTGGWEDNPTELQGDLAHNRFPDIPVG
jgi:hypothetical protein